VKDCNFESQNKEMAGYESKLLNGSVILNTPSRVMIVTILEASFEGIQR
jgi:hypothetical protein